KVASRHFSDVASTPPLPRRGLRPPATLGNTAIASICSRSLFSQRGLAFNCLAVPALKWCRHDHGSGHVALREHGGAISSFLSLRFCSNSLQYFVGCDRNFIDANSYSVIDCIRNSRWNRQLRSLSRFLRAKRAIGVSTLDQISNDVAHLQSRRALVFKERRKLVNHIAVTPVGHLFHKRFSKPHVDAALDLTYDQHGIDSLANVMCDPHAWNDDDAGFGINLYFGYRCSTSEGWGWTDGRPLVFSRCSRRLVGTRRTEGAEFLLSQPNRIHEAHALFRILCIKNAPIRKS